MTSINLSPALFLLVGVWLAAGAQAAEPEFRAALVTASRVYEREAHSFSVAGVGAAQSTVTTSRVTVTLDGQRITAEWVPKTTISATAKDFPRGSDVAVAIKRNEMVLKLEDGSTVTAKIVDREKADTEVADQRRRN